MRRRKHVGKYGRYHRHIYVDAELSAESYVNVTAILDVAKLSDRWHLPHVLHGSLPTGVQYKPDLMALSFTGKNEKNTFDRIWPL